jgi:hypothetical protein
MMRKDSGFENPNVTAFAAAESVGADSQMKYFFFRTFGRLDEHELHCRSIISALDQSAAHPDSESVARNGTQSRKDAK